MRKKDREGRKSEERKKVQRNDTEWAGKEIGQEIGDEMVGLEQK